MTDIPASVDSQLKGIVERTQPDSGPKDYITATMSGMYMGLALAVRHPEWTRAFIARSAAPAFYYNERVEGALNCFVHGIPLPTEEHDG
jgi:hypothetical protein